MSVDPAVQLAEIYEDDMLPWILSIMFILRRYIMYLDLHVRICKRLSPFYQLGQRNFSFPPPA
jgi:hypothetical protein